jgi:hypothetical protein
VQQSLEAHDDFLDGLHDLATWEMKRYARHKALAVEGKPR